MTEDQANSTYQSMVAAQNLATRASQTGPVISGPKSSPCPKRSTSTWLPKKSWVFRLVLERIIRFKPYTLNRREEEILAMQGEMAGAASKAFRQLLDADMKFGLVKDEKGQQVELSNATFSKLLISPAQNVRKAAFHQYYQQFSAASKTRWPPRSTGSMQKRRLLRQGRGYRQSARSRAVSDNVPPAVYDNLMPRCTATCRPSIATTTCAAGR